LLPSQRRLPPGSTLFPYTTLFRSRSRRCGDPTTCTALGRGAVSKEAFWPGMSSGGRPAKNPERSWLGSWLSAAGWPPAKLKPKRSEEHTSELQSRRDLVCRLLLEK